MKVTINDFNLFPSVSPTIDQNEIKTQKISTKLFCILLVLIITILLLYTSLIRVVKTVTINDPTVDKYVELYDQYSQTLSCPCTKILINYEDILEIQYLFHPICYSDFIDQEWITLLNFYSAPNHAHMKDLFFASSQIFQGLKSFCSSIENILSNNLNKFYRNEYVSAYVKSSQLFNSEVILLIDQFRNALINDYFLFFSMIHETTEGNALLSVQMTNFEMYPWNETTVRIRPAEFGNCSCSYSSSCTTEAAFINYNNNTNIFVVPELYIGCYFIKSLLLSTLTCLFQKQCILHFTSFFTYLRGRETRWLDSSFLNVYSNNSTVQDLVDQLMIDTWNSSTMYNQYYNECQPAQCTYSYETRNDLVFIITTLIGLVGGLTTSLKIVIPRLVKLIRDFLLKRRQVDLSVAD